MQWKRSIVTSALFVLRLLTVFCNVIDNTTRRSVTVPASRDVKNKNPSASVFSTRSNFISAATVLNPPKHVTEPRDWGDFRHWATYSRNVDEVLETPKDAEVWVKDLDETGEDYNELEDLRATTDQLRTKGVAVASTPREEQSTYYIFKHENGREVAVTLGNVEIPYYRSEPRGKDTLRENHAFVDVGEFDNYSGIGSETKLRDVSEKEHVVPAPEVNTFEPEVITTPYPEATVAPKRQDDPDLARTEEERFGFHDDHQRDTNSTVRERFEKLRELIEKIEKQSIGKSRSLELSPQADADETSSNVDALSALFDQYERNGSGVVQTTASQFYVESPDAVATPTERHVNQTPMAQALLHVSTLVTSSRDVNATDADGSATPDGQSGSGVAVRRSDSLLERLTQTQFSWVDVIIAVCVTAALLLIAINVGVCAQYCVQKRGRVKRFRPYSVPLSSSLRMRIDSLRLRTPRLRNRPWLSSNRSLFERCGETNNGMWAESTTTSSSNNGNSSSNSSSSRHVTPTATTDVTIMTPRHDVDVMTSPRVIHRATSFHDPTTPSSAVVVATEKGTQYESTDAMIANFVNSDLIVELNDRDSTCTSISEGFTFSRDYGAPKPLYSSVTDL